MTTPLFRILQMAEAVPEVWVDEISGSKYYGACGPRDVLIIVSSESLEGPDIVPRKKGSLTQEDKDRLTSELDLQQDNLRHESEYFQDEAKLLEARYLRDKKICKSVNVHNDPEHSAESVKDMIAIFLSSTKQPGVYIHYIGPGRRHTGDWCFKDGFITFKDIKSLYTLHFQGKTIEIYSDCSFSGHWVTLGMDYLDECKIKPCGHSGREAKTQIVVVGSCRPDQIAHTFAYSVRGLSNDKNKGRLCYNSDIKVEKDQISCCVDSTRHKCKSGNFDVPCTFPNDYTWKKKRFDERLFLRKYRDGFWVYIFLIDDADILYQARNDLLNDISLYGEVVKSGHGDEPSIETVQWSNQNYPGHTIRY